MIISCVFALLFVFRMNFCLIKLYSSYECVTIGFLVVLR